MAKAARKTIIKPSSQNVPAIGRTPIDPSTYPDVYCLTIDGDCMEPLLPHGSSVVMKKSEKFKAGDVVCIWFKPELCGPDGHQSWLKKLTLNIPPWVKSFPHYDHPDSNVRAALLVEQLKPPQGYSMRLSDVLAVHKAVGYAPAGKIGGSISLDEIEPIGDGRLPALA